MNPFARRAIVVVIAAAALLGSPAHALSPLRQITEYPVDFWQGSSGLAQNQVSVLLQSRDGYLWVGTKGGLSRFDGVRFTEFSRRTRHLRVDDVIALAEGPDGRIWIGTAGGGLSRLTEDGRVTTWGREEGLPHDQIQALALDAAGVLWIGTPSGLATLDKNERLTKYGLDADLPKSPAAQANANVRALLVDRKGVLWIGTTQGLASFAQGRFTNYATQRPGELDQWIERITLDPAHEGIWLAGREAQALGSGSLGRGTGVLGLHDGVVTRLDAADGLGARVSDLTFDRDGTLWLATDRGLYRRRADGRFEAYLSTFERVGTEGWVQTVSLRHPLTVLGDREGSLWVGTGEDGLARLRDSIVTTVGAGKIEGTEQPVSVVRQGKDGALWFGLDGQAIARFEDGALKTFRGPDTALIYTVAEDPSGVVWVGDRNGLLTLQGDRLVPMKLDPTLKRAVCLLVDARGDMWVATKFAGIFRSSGGAWTHYTVKDGLPTDEINGLAIDSTGGLWMATRVGISVMRLGASPDGTVQVKSYGVKDGLPSRFVGGIYVDSRDVVWAASREGLSRLEKGRIFTYTADHGFPTDALYQIVEDDFGHLWLTHPRGVLRVARADLDAVAAGRARSVAYRTFGAESGMQSTSMPDFTQPAAWKAVDGRLWFATGRGVAGFDPRALTTNTLPPPVKVEEIHVDGQLFLPRADMAFAPGRGDVEIHYTGLSLVDPQRVRFRYRLDGVDALWVDAGTRRVAYYTKLPPGSYDFRVMACNNDGVWNEKGQGLRFTLRPHWYQRRLVRAAMLALLGLALLAVHRARVREHKQRALDLARHVEEALAQIKVLRGMVPICANCKKIRDDQGYWSQMETYIAQHSEADFSHGICPECLAQLYPDYAGLTEGGGGGPSAGRRGPQKR